MKTKLFTGIVVLSTMMTSCEKWEIKTAALATLVVTNVMNNRGSLIFGTNPTRVYNRSFQAYGVLTGSQHIKLVDTTGADQVYYDQTNELVNGEVYSLFLSGTPAAVESVLVKEENIPSHTADIFGKRVINLIVGDMSISVNLAGAANGSFVPRLAYKAISSFKDVSSLAAEIRNVASGALIKSFIIPAYDVPRFRNITLVVIGTQLKKLLSELITINFWNYGC